MKKIKATDGNYIILDDNVYEVIKNSKYNLCHTARSYYYRGKRLIKVVLEINNIKQEKYQGYFFKNHNKLDFRFENLINKKEKFIYYKKTKKIKTTSKYKGVSWDKEAQKWKASLTKNYKKYNLGRYEDEIDAAKAYDKKFDELELEGIKNFN